MSRVPNFKNSQSEAGFDLRKILAIPKIFLKSRLGYLGFTCLCKMSSAVRVGQGRKRFGNIFRKKWGVENT
jgi:hypothetical protein